MTILSKFTLTNGDLGCEMKPPAGTPVLSDEGELMDRLVIFDKENMVTWRIQLFESLHMDLRESMRSHLEQGIEK
jgi:hypothetical protein